MRWSFGCWILTDLYVIAENWRREFDFQDCDSLFGRVCEHLLSCCAFILLDTIARIMSTLGPSSPIWAHRAQAHQMRIPMICQGIDSDGYVLPRRGRSGLVYLVGRIWSAGF